ncbi:MAG: hypothetical protein M1834_001855 [Cirrosporium novae-zelandiae]|nr:MAG: hypothetical protein M1834_001855 [Cirrosporium novae-zelandiae]
MAKSVAKISLNDPYSSEPYTYYPVVIVGAGESGIALGCQLKEQLGFDQFRIFDRQSQLGGTWHINRYPGIACDIPAPFYSFSFAPNYQWTTFHPPGEEILQYLTDVCEKYGIVDKIQLNTDVVEARWLEKEELWEVILQHMALSAGDLSAKNRQTKIREEGEASVFVSQERIKAKILASCVGGLVEPKSIPEVVPGFESFKGKVFHSARWDYNVDLSNKDVVVVGTGCSAAQFTPRLPNAPFNARSVTQVMRSPPWVVPRQKPPFGEEWWSKWSPKLLSNIPGLGWAVRLKVFLGTEADWELFGGEERHEKARKKLEAELLKHMKRTVPEKYHEILTPDYSVGCKRRIFDAIWFPGLNNPKIGLTTRPLTCVQPDSVILGPGRTYPDPNDSKSKAPTDEIRVSADVIILANGFDTTQWLSPLKVIGKHGKEIHDVWRERGGAQAYQGATMDGFPNMFVIFGPNTATGHSSVVLGIENMVMYSLHFMKRILSGEVSSYDVKEEVEREYTRDIQEKLNQTVFNSGGCTNWYQDRVTGWNSTAYPCDPPTVN